MISKKVIASLILISGVVMSLIGVTLIVGYVREAYIARIGESDQSLLFWYLPLLLAGFIFIGFGVS